MTSSDIKKELQKYANPARARVSQRFFKTGKGEYGEGDVFIGPSVPECRKVAIKFKDIPLGEVAELLRSKIHEERLVALLILVGKFPKAPSEEKKEIYEFYLKNTRWVNNWDLVDLSSEKIVGAWCFETKSTEVLDKLAGSSNVWERRIAIISTFYFIKNGQSQPTIRIAEKLIADKTDLIQKAVGWMLREMGKRVSLEEEMGFLDKNYRDMPRTALRYAIERFSPETRLKYLAK